MAARSELLEADSRLAAAAAQGAIVAEVEAAAVENHVMRLLEDAPPPRDLAAALAAVSTTMAEPSDAYAQTVDDRDDEDEEGETDVGGMENDEELMETCARARAAVMAAMEGHAALVESARAIESLRANEEAAEFAEEMRVTSHAHEVSTKVMHELAAEEARIEVAAETQHAREALARAQAASEHLHMEAVVEAAEADRRRMADLAIVEEAAADAVNRAGAIRSTTTDVVALSAREGADGKMSLSSPSTSELHSRHISRSRTMFASEDDDSVSRAIKLAATTPPQAQTGGRTPRADALLAYAPRRVAPRRVPLLAILLFATIALVGLFALAPPDLVGAVKFSSPFAAAPVAEPCPDTMGRRQQIACRKKHRKEVR